MRGFWTPERDDVLLRLRAEGVEFSAIAERLGTTKDACCGRFWRMHHPCAPRREPLPQDIRIGLLIAQARREAGLTLRSLGAAIRKTHNAIRAYERGGARPTEVTLSEIARVTRKPTSWFHERQGEGDGDGEEQQDERAHEREAKREGTGSAQEAA